MSLRVVHVAFLVAMASTSGCRCAPGEDWIARGDGSAGTNPFPLDDLSYVGDVEANAAVSDAGVLLVADVQKVDVGADGATAWGRAHFVVAEVLRGSGVAKGAEIVLPYACQPERGRGRPVGWQGHCPDRTRRYALWLVKKTSDWEVRAATGRVSSDDADGMRRSVALRPGTLSPSDRATRLGEALRAKNDFLRKFARDELRYARDLPREAAARALLAAVATTEGWDPRASMLDAAAERLCGANDPPADVDREILQAATRAFVSGEHDHARSRGFQTLFHALNPGIADRVERRATIAKRLAIAKTVDPGPERVVAALREFTGRGGITNGERSLISVYETGDSE